MLWKYELFLSLFEMLELLSRRQQRKSRPHKHLHGESIDNRQEYVLDRNEFGHWEADTVIGKKNKEDAVVFTIVERLTGYNISIKIDGKTVSGVVDAMRKLYRLHGSKFSLIFRSINTDNDSEFADFASMEAMGTKVYFAHPYSSWERHVNERSNRLLRRFIPKGTAISIFGAD